MSDSSEHIDFPGIIGQPVPLRVLSHLLDKSRLPGTLLFSGPAGVGKLASAIALAKRLHCERKCEGLCECDSCRAIRTGSHPDVIVLSREKLIGVEDMRELVAMTGLRSAPGQERVVIIDRAENITQAGANAALKMLEEPGDHLRFILITDAPAALLPTVRSRSYRLRFSTLSSKALGEFARAIGDDPDEKESSEAMIFAAGRPGRYLRYRHSEGYRDVVREISRWAEGAKNRQSIEAALVWKQAYREKADELAQAERSIGLPRGGDIFEIARWIAEGGKFTVSPINWRIEEKADRENRWGEGRKILLLAGLLCRIVGRQDGSTKADAAMKIRDFMQKVRWNCSFDIALERLYFSL